MVVIEVSGMVLQLVFHHPDMVAEQIKARSIETKGKTLL